MAATNAVGVALPSRYKFVRVLGTGTHGIVCEAIDTESGEKIAVKTLKRIDMDLKLQQEIASLRRVQHPNCVRLKRIEQTPSCTFLVMDLCSGGELFEKIKRKGPMPETSAKKVALSLLKAVAHLHENGLMHRGT